MTDRETPQLRAAGMVGVSVTVGRTVLKPGDSVDVPSHLVAELALALRNGLLSTKQPPPVTPRVLFDRSAPKVEVAKVEPLKPTVVETPTDRTDEPNTEHRRRRR